MSHRSVLNIDTSLDLIDQWVEWLMPVEQPYLVDSDVAAALQLKSEPERLTPELRDTFELYSPGDCTLVWLPRAQAGRLPESVRRSQPAPHRWPSRDQERNRDRAAAFVAAGRHNSRHADISDAQWAEIQPILPLARHLAGTHPSRSGPNCFGTVMGAAGVDGAADEWMQREPFEGWLKSAAVPVRNSPALDDIPGVVLVWRNADHQVAHALITLGAGFALHKPSQGWMSPRLVLTVREAMTESRYPGLRCERHALRTQALSTQAATL